jgi:hypothetical protein
MRVAHAKTSCVTISQVLRAAAAPAAEDVIRARLGDVQFAPEPPASFLYMPAGRHTIAPFLAGKPFEITVEIGPDTVATLNRTLAAHLAGNRKPFFCFDHEEKTASFWPERFDWSPEGVRVSGEWSDAGRHAIQGRTHRSFSPSFTTDKLNTTADDPARVKGAPLAMGSLVNNQAFDRLPPLWAKNSGATGANQNQELMNKLAELKASLTKIEAELNVLQAAKAGEQNAEVLRAKQSERTALTNQIQAEEALQAAQAAKAQADEKIVRFEAEEKTRRETLAEQTIQAAQSRGVFPMQPAADSADAKEIARWRSLIVADPANATLLARLGERDALSQPLTAGRSRIEVGTSQDNIMAAFAREKDPTQRGLIYLADIKPIFTKGEEFTVKAANSLGALVGNLISLRALDLLAELYPWLKSVTTDFSAESADYGQTIITRTLTVPAATDYNTTTGYADSDANSANVSVNISAHKAVQISFNANEMAGTKRRLIEEHAQSMQYAIGKTLADAVGALILNATFTGNTATASANMSRNNVVDMVVALNGRKAPQLNRSVVLNATYYGQLMKDASLVSLALTQAWGAATSGKVPEVAGAQIYQWVDLPNNSENLTGFACTPDALVVATRLPNDYAMQDGVPQTAVQEVVTNPHTGMSVQLTRFVDHKLGKSYARAAWMLGAAAGQTASLQRLKSA